MRKLNSSFFQAAFLLISILIMTSGAQAHKPQKKQLTKPDETGNPESIFLKKELADFEQFVIKAKKQGVTHVDITFNIPPALWQFDTPGDPYPVWYAYSPGLMKIFPPSELKSYVNLDYAEKIASLIQSRCEILRRYGLKGVYSTNEPYVLPEKFFTDHPEFRGARVDHPNRSKVARFAPCVDQPEVLAMYRESMQLLLKRCPEIEIFSLLTSDSGSGFCWSSALYSGLNGNANCEDRPLEDRVVGFLENLRDAAKEIGAHIEINIHPISPRQWMIPTFDHPETISARLKDGLTISNYKNADGQQVPRSISGMGNFSPILGLSNPLTTARRLTGTIGNDIPGDSKLLISYSDPSTSEFNLELYEFFKQEKPENTAEMMKALRDFAGTITGDQGADDLLEVWIALDGISNDLQVLNFGSVLTFGPVLARWINRPLVPFPEELSAEEKSYYRQFLFQAKGEDQANNLIDIQAMRMFEGYGARLLVQRVYEMVIQKLTRAENLSEKLLEKEKNPESVEIWAALKSRLAVLHSLMRTIDNVVAYQALLDLVHARGVDPEVNPVLGTRATWDRQEILRIARNEIDNTVSLKKLLESSKIPLIQTATIPEYETIRMLGPDLPLQLKRKIDIMNAHWLDYNKLYTSPNL